MSRPGAFVISLDFELHWGFFDRTALDARQRQYLMGARSAVEELLQLFGQQHIHATWAVVGLLMAENRSVREALLPPVKPNYVDSRLDPYAVEVGESEADDPFHYASSLVKKITASEGQELATHTFGHYYCLEAGQGPETFQSDLQAAMRVAEQHGVRPRSIVFPRNQHNREYEPLLVEQGITSYRGNPVHPWYAALDSRAGRSPWRRAGRLLDSYLNLTGDHTQSWDELKSGGGLLHQRASRFLRPWSRTLRVLEPLKERRITASMRSAARRGEVYHLWWHPHNFSTHRAEKLAQLRHILEYYHELQQNYGMLSLNMGEIADIF